MLLCESNDFHHCNTLFDWVKSIKKYIITFMEKYNGERMSKKEKEWQQRKDIKEVIQCGAFLSPSVKLLSCILMTLNFDHELPVHTAPSFFHFSVKYLCDFILLRQWYNSKRLFFYIVSALICLAAFPFAADIWKLRRMQHQNNLF